VISKDLWLDIIQLSMLFGFLPKKDEDDTFICLKSIPDILIDFKETFIE
jgi:hypothetical protein